MGNGRDPDRTALADQRVVVSGDGDVFRHGDSLFFQHGDDGERDLVVVADGGIDRLFAVEQHGKHQGRFGFPVLGVKPDDVFGIIRDSAFLQRLHVTFMALGALAVVGLEDADDVSSAGL